MDVLFHYLRCYLDMQVDMEAIFIHTRSQKYFPSINYVIDACSDESRMNSKWKSAYGCHTYSHGVKLLVFYLGILQHRHE